MIFISCKSAPREDKTGDEATGRRNGNGLYQQEGLAEEIRSLTETGTLLSMLRAVELIRERDLGGSEFGRMMNGINVTLIKQIYPDYGGRLPSVDLPQTHNYARIMREAERGYYSAPAPESVDFLEYILPSLSLFDRNTTEQLLAALPHLEKAGEMRPDSILPPFFQGMVLERLERFGEAEAAYDQCYGISPDCYPALAGTARVIGLSGRKREAAAFFLDLVNRYPDSLWLKRQLAIAHYENRDWTRALGEITEILQRDPRDGDIILLRAHIFVERGQYSQAQGPLDTYASINQNNRLYLFLRARVQAEGYRNRDSALNYLRLILRSNPNDEEAAVYTIGLLMESQRQGDQAEAREMLLRLQNTSGSSPAVLSLSLRDAISRESWREAQGLLNRIFTGRRSNQDLIDAYRVERGLGNNSRALAFARELYERDASNDDGIVIYISALIDAGRGEEASGMIETRLASVGSGSVKSRYFLLRSRIRSTEEETLNDLRSSLFEDPRNLQTLIATFEFYHLRGEERRAAYYLRQALSISPDNQRLRRYEQEYASLLGN